MHLRNLKRSKSLTTVTSSNSKKSTNQKRVNSASSLNLQMVSLIIPFNLLLGGTLKELLGKQGERRILESQIIKWFTQLCRGMKYVHDMGVIHRDLKCENVLLTSDG